VMVETFVQAWEKRKGELEAKYREQHPSSYGVIVRDLVGVLGAPGDYGTPDPSRITEIDDGDYQGTLVFVVAEHAYQPHVYWVTKVAYGSCSGCDTLQDIRGYTNAPPTAQQTADYMTLALHILQGFKEV
jgi:hypothetical protein